MPCAPYYCLARGAVTSGEIESVRYLPLLLWRVLVLIVVVIVSAYASGIPVFIVLRV